MEFMFDTANLDIIKKFADIYPYTGVTSNPSIIKNEGKLDFFNHFRTVQSFIGKERRLYLQVVAEDCETMLAEAELLNRNLKDVIVKIPVTREGVKAIGILKKRGYCVTATAIFNELQGYVALAAGADYLAPYYNRIEAMGGDPVSVIAALKDVTIRQGLPAKLIAASFHETIQVQKAIAAGADSVTLSPVLLDKINSDMMKNTVENFKKDWSLSQGCENLLGISTDF